MVVPTAVVVPVADYMAAVKAEELREVHLAEAVTAVAVKVARKAEGVREEAVMVALTVEGVTGVAAMAAVATEVAAMAAETRTAPSRLQTAGCDHRQCHHRSMSPRTSCRRTPDEDGRRAARRGSPARL